MSAEQLSKRDQILTAVAAFMRQRPGLEFGNYGDIANYRAEVRSITKDLHDARTLLAAVWRSSITEQELRAAFSAFSGRLSIVDREDGKVALDYCTGQYFPTEYRRAVCAVLAQALWDRCRDHCMPEGEVMHNSETGETITRYNGMRAGDYMRKSLRREFGAPIARRWFN